MSNEDSPYTGTRRPTDDRYQVDYFDRKMGELHGLPQVIESKESNITEVDITNTLTYVVKTMRHRELGDFVFLVSVDGRQTIRLVIPPRVTDAIARQRDALSTKLRKRIARTQAAERKAAGIVPTHLMNPEVRRRALKSRKAKAAKRRARKERKAAAP